MIKQLFLLLTTLFLSCRAPMDDSTAIQQLLEKESATWRTGDFAAHSDCWHIQPYSRILVSTTAGETFDVPPALMKDPDAPMGDGGTSVNSNYKMSIQGDHAWVSHDEISTARDGQKVYSHEIRILEKVKGAWKLVGQSIHQYDPQ
jgi:hypothetical protein